MKLIINAIIIDLITGIIIIRELKEHLEGLFARQWAIKAILVGKSATVAKITTKITVIIICGFIPIKQVIMLEGSAITATKPLIAITIAAKIIQQA